MVKERWGTQAIYNLGKPKELFGRKKKQMETISNLGVDWFFRDHPQTQLLWLVAVETII